MKPRGRLIRRWTDRFGDAWEEWEEKASPSIAPRPAPTPYDESAAWVVEHVEALQRQEEERKAREAAEGVEPWD